jgi:hypothetical protein
MTRSIAAALMLTATLSIAAPQTAEAQLGRLIKKKVKEAVKPPEKPSDPAPAPAAPSPKSVLVLPVGGFHEHEYSVMIERLIKYCELKKSMDVSPKKGGLKVHGVGGPNINWVYTADELTALKNFDCGGFFKKYGKLIGSPRQ